MPAVWEQNISKVAVLADEVIPAFYNCLKTLQTNIQRYADKNYGIKRLQRACFGRPMLIDFDTLPREIQMALGDPRKVAHVMERWFQMDQKAKAYYADKTLIENNPTSHIPGAKQEEYTLNASILQAVKIYKDEHVNEMAKKKKKAKKLYEFMSKECQAFQKVLKTKFDGLQHSLPASERQFREVYDGFFSSEGLNYDHLISGKLLNDNARKLSETKQHALLRKLLGHGNNFNYAQVMEMYNQVASENDWATVTRKAVENFAKANKLDTEVGRRGIVNFDNTMSMQRKRKAVGYPMLLWSVDGWDVELLYQKTELNKNGHSVTTYHHRPTIVVVLDPFTNYPIGYAIGTHETPALVRQAVRNAIMHTAELTGTMLKPNQFQSDRYGNGNLTPFFEAASVHYIPARAKNAKAKPIEKYFDYFNESYCHYLKNWSGHNVTSSNDNQPNADYKNKIRHSFPDWNGVVAQLETLVDQERAKKRVEYLEGLSKLPTEYKQVFTTEQFLFQLGEIKQRTSKFGGNGLVFDIKNIEYAYDSFDILFRRYTHLDWQVRYNPADMSTVLACNEDSTVRFLMEEKQIEGSNLLERNEADDINANRINAFNKNMKQSILDRMIEDSEEVEDLLENGNDTLAKMLLVDSTGQHKDQRNANRRLPKVKKEIPEKVDTTLADAHAAYIDSKINLNDYL